MTGIRIATRDDAAEAARLLYDFNLEYDDPTPEPDILAERLRTLLDGGDTAVLLTGSPAIGLVLMRFRLSLWSSGQECYVAELYIRPAHRGRGLGRELMRAAMDHARARAADYMDLNTGETDTAARGLYESLGFSDHEGRPDRPVNLYYERDL